MSGEDPSLTRRSFSHEKNEVLAPNAEYGMATSGLVMLYGICNEASWARHIADVMSACPSLECGAENDMRPVGDMYLLTLERSERMASDIDLEHLNFPSCMVVRRFSCISVLFYAPKVKGRILPFTVLYISSAIMPPMPVESVNPPVKRHFSFRDLANSICWLNGVSFSLCSPWT